MRVAVTGAAGRLGRAVVEALEEAPFTGPWGPVAWSRPAFDLDAPDAFAALLERDRPELVVHCAAWTDVDGCAREPALALARNGTATGLLASACATRGIDLVVVSTNEIFDGARTDGRGYTPEDLPSPPNPYGVSKLAGERAAVAAYGGDGGSVDSPARVPAAADAGILGIVRTAWLYGPPGNDFPAKVAAAADRALAAGEPLPLVVDEVGTPTYAPDVAEALVELIGANEHAGIHHLVNGGLATRADWGRAVLEGLGIAIPVREVSRTTWVRASTPPAWGVLEPTPLPGGEPIRPWQLALADYLPALERARAGARPAR